MSSRFRHLCVLLLVTGLAGQTHTNHLAGERSPYLLQHAHNPVDWYPWGKEAFDKARRENKPVFLSVGYATCHWCHVMERESFEDEGVAAILNKDFVSIKVDREERPDIDATFMTFVEATTGGGGWPMNVWLTPALKPFFGGTYFRKDQLLSYAGQIAAAWKNESAKILDSSAAVLKEIQELRKRPEPAALDPKVADRAFAQFAKRFDAKYAGFGESPKFPEPVNLNFLLRYHARSKNQQALDMDVATLRAMAAGGIHDQLGGGFHRYSTDQRWFLPHFEKMLYDQALIAIAYTEAFQATHDSLFEQTARGILDYVLGSMTDRSGGFWSAEDADSEKVEGAYYVWRKSEIDSVLSAAGIPANARGWFCYRYGVMETTNVDRDPFGEFKGKDVLYRAHTVDETAVKFGATAAEVERALSECRGALLKVRARRVRPAIDDKVLTSWNSLMISALSAGARVFEEPRYEAAAKRAAQLILTKLYDPKSAKLLRRYRAGDAAIPGFLDDYAYFAQAMIDLYETTFDPADLETALRVTTAQRAIFEDQQRGGFHDAVSTDSGLLETQEAADNVQPSGNSVAVSNLFRLAQYTDRRDLKESADRALMAFGASIGRNPSAYPQMLAAAGFGQGKPRQIILVGPRGPAMSAMLRTLNQVFLADRIVVMIDSESTRKAMAKYLPVVESMVARNNRPTAFVCENYACKLPVQDVAKFAALLR